MISTTNSQPQSVEDKSIIHLNVGGESFTTLYKTLSKSTFFQNLLHGAMSKTVADDGIVFVDRDGKLFRDVLLYLRTSSVFTKDREKLNSLLLEAQFYRIWGLETRLRFLIDNVTETEEAHPSIVWKGVDDIRNRLHSSIFVLTEKMDDSERSYQILDIVYGDQKNGYCDLHRAQSCSYCCGVKLVLLCRD